MIIGSKTGYHVSLFPPFLNPGFLSGFIWSVKEKKTHLFKNIVGKYVQTAQNSVFWIRTIVKVKYKRTHCSSFGDTFIGTIKNVISQNI